jgi:hypothetical protein
MSYLTVLLSYQSSSDEFWLKIIVGGVSFLFVYGIIVIINKIKSRRNRFQNSSKIVPPKDEYSKPDDTSGDQKSQHQNQTSVFEKDDQIETLKELREKGIIQIFEYEEKYKKLQEQITNEKLNDDLKKKQQVIDDRIAKKSQPLIELACKAKLAGLISGQEYEIKELEIIEKTKKEVLGQFAQIDFSLYNTLSQTKQEKVNMYLDEIGDTDTIVLHHNKIKVFNQKSWTEIIEDGIANNFQIIFQDRSYK